MNSTQTPAGKEPARTAARFWSFSVLLMLALAIGFALQQYVIVYKGKPYETYFALSAYGMKSWYVWELFTFQGMQSNVVHLLVNLAGLWFLGRTLEAALGWKRFLILWIGAGLAGGVAQGALAWAANFLPDALDQFRNPAAGASAGLCGVLAVVCRMQPEANFRFGVSLPVPNRHVLWVALLVCAIAAAIPFGPTQASDAEEMWKAIWWAPMNLAHAGHLGGLLGGMLFFKWGWLGPGVRAAATANPAGGPG